MPDFMVFSNLVYNIYNFGTWMSRGLVVWLDWSCKHGINTVLSTRSLGSLWFLTVGWDQKEALMER